ncbi:MAG: carboxylesterase/lipase family protein [Polaromonas sp.]|nr:carboxylesterase/lipase family protein [Polaromonas sp.]
MGASCPQKRGLALEGGGDPGVIDEDCLYLNVFTPRAEAGAKLPVMVWIHGGALIFGGGGLPLYDGSALARRGAVVVTLNYRLGRLGFFTHPALEQERPGGPVNFGLFDQIAALQWVQQNIGAFGGDASKVTVFGQSAGAQSVLALMASHLAAGLFHGAIAESPYAFPGHTRAKAAATGAAIADAVGLPGARASMDALRRIPAERLSALDGNEVSLTSSFITGDAAVPLPLLEVFQQGREAAVPLVIGSNSDDASVVLAFGIDPAQAVQKLGKARVLVKAFYPEVKDERQLGLAMGRDVGFTAFARRIAYLHSQKAPSWRYYFSHTGVGAGSAGAGHGAEVPYVMGTTQQCQCLGQPATPLDLAVEHRLGDRWVGFASTGKPEGGVAWPQDDRGRGVVLDIGDQDTVRPGFMSARLNTIITGLKWAGSRAARQ